jgi:hypothetical protein
VRVSGRVENVSCRRVEVGCLHSTGRGRFLGARRAYQRGRTAQPPPRPADHHHHWHPLRPGQGGAPGRRQGCLWHGANQGRCCPASVRSDDIARAPHASQPSHCKIIHRALPSPCTSDICVATDGTTSNRRLEVDIHVSQRLSQILAMALAQPALIADALLSETYHVESLARRMQVVSCETFHEGTSVQQRQLVCPVFGYARRHVLLTFKRAQPPTF